MTLKINEIEKTYVVKELVYCCTDIEIACKNGPLIISTKDNNDIETTIVNAHYVAYINYCPFCGEKLQDEK